MIDIPSEQELKKGKLPQATNSQLYIFAYAHDSDIILDTQFDTVALINDLSKWTPLECTLNYVSLNKNYYIDYIPRGLSALCLFEFRENINIITGLLSFLKQKDKIELILTQKTIIDALKS